MGFYDVHDPDASMTEFDSCEAGTYKISGLGDWITKADGSDSMKVPVYVVDKFKGMVVRVNLSRVDSGIEPAANFSPVEMVLLAKAFGVSRSQLPAEQNTSEFLMRVKHLINESNKTVTATLNKPGWVSYIKEMTPPEGLYRWSVKKMRSLDGSEPVVFQTSKFDNEQLVIDFQLNGDGITGKPTAFDGYVLPAYVINGFDGAVDGRPSLLLRKNKAKSYYAARWEKFAKAYAPDVLEDGYNWTNPESPETEIAKFAVTGKRKAVIQYAPNKNGRLSLVLDTLQALDEDVHVEEDVALTAGVLVNEHPNLAELCEYILKECPGAFSKTPLTSLEDVVLTDEGKEWADTGLLPHWVEAGMPSDGAALNSLDETALTRFARTELFHLSETDALKMSVSVWSGSSGIS